MSEKNKYGMRLLDIYDAENGILAYAIAVGSITDEVAAIIWQRFDDAKVADKNNRRGTKHLNRPLLHPVEQPEKIFSKLVTVTF